MADVDQAGAKGADGDEWSVDELARRGGTSVRNVRLYQERGVLARPRREGRRGLYNAGHLNRLRLVLSMLRRGYTLSTIRELFDASEARRSLDDVIGFEAVLAEPFTTEEARRLTVDDVIGLFPGATPEAFDRAVGMGLLVPDGDGFVAPSPTLIDAGAELLSGGVPMAAVLDAAEAIFWATDRLAERFVGMFIEHLWEPFVEKGMPPEELPALTAALERMRPLAARGVVAGLAQAMQRRADEAAAVAGVLRPPAPQ